MKIVVIVLMLFSNIAFSQSTAIQPVATTDPAATITKVVRVRYGNARALNALATNGAPVSSNADSILQVIVLHGRVKDVAAVEQTIHELDMPASAQAFKMRDIELIVSVIGGSNKNELLPEGQTSEAIAPVIRQLRAIFPYKNYQLLSSMLLRSSEGTGAMSSGIMKSFSSFENYSHASGYGISYEKLTISSEDKQIIHIQNFQFKTTVRTQVGNTSQSEPTDITLTTNVDLREGQKIVAGKANIDSSDLALFIVLTAKILE